MVVKSIVSAVLIHRDARVLREGKQARMRHVPHDDPHPPPTIMSKETEAIR